MMSQAHTLSHDVEITSFRILFQNPPDYCPNPALTLTHFKILALQPMFFVRQYCLAR